MLLYGKEIKGLCFCSRTKILASVLRDMKAYWFSIQSGIVLYADIRGVYEEAREVVPPQKKIILNYYKM